MAAGKKKEKVGVQDIANVLNVSISTVSRALNDNPRISREMKEKVKQVASHLGYFPGIPELINPEKKEVIAILVPTLASGLYREIISGAVDFMNKNNFQAFLLDIRNDDSRAFSFFKTYRKYGISGMIHLISNRNLPVGFYSIIQNDTLPLVTVFEPNIADGISSVLPDMFQGVYKIMKYLKPLKTNNITLILENKNKPEDYQLASSFRMASELSGMKETDSTIYYFERNEDAFVKKLEALLIDKNRPQVLLVKDTLVAAETAKIAERLKIKIPDDLLLVAVGIPENTELTANLSLLKIPGYEMGYQAAEMLLKQIKQSVTEKKVTVLPVNFILKGSAIRLK